MIGAAMRRGPETWRRAARYWLARAVLAVATVIGLPAAPLSAQPETPLLRLQLNWMHQAQFVGFYVAETLGFYQREGIAVEFIPGGPPFPGGPAPDPLEVLELGGADLAVAWMSNAFAARKAGMDVVNIAQIFRRPGMSLACRRSAGVHRESDVKGKRIGLWNVGDQVNLNYWLRQKGLKTSDVTLLPQRPDGADLIANTIDCATAMSYNEYWTLLRNLRPSDLFLVGFAEAGAGFLEDGVYAKASALADPEARARFVRFVRASIAGWRYARDNPEVAVAVTLQRAPGADAVHQRRMLESVLSLAETQRETGLLDLGALDRSAAILTLDGAREGGGILQYGWTHEIWREATGKEGLLRLTPAVKHYLERIVDAPWFYIVGLIGVAASMVGAFMRAVQRRYDLWGAFVLTLLAIGGGVLRDLLIGGDRLPLFMFSDPAYIALVINVIIIGTVVTRPLPESALDSRRFTLTLEFFDAIGVATFTVLGTHVALVAGLAWYWAPFCAALSCAGGGMLRDIVTGREPRTFQGEPYEEIAVVGSLALVGMLALAGRHGHADWLVTAAIPITMISVFAARMLVVVFGWRSFRLGHAQVGAEA